LAINGHPNPDLLQRFAAGDLPMAAGLVVESHAETCPGCARNLTRFETDHGHALSDLPDAPMRPDALERALARLGDTRPAPTHLGDALLPKAIVRQGLHARRFIGPDFWVAPVRRSRREAWRAYILRAPAGTRIPAHRHLGQEYFQVLTGAVVGSALHTSGDFVSEPPGLEHVLQVGQAPCACLIAVENGAQWRGVTRWLSSWLGV
jgi:putative transcriptional regulator